MVSILFFVKRTKRLKNGQAPIFLRITTDKQRAEISLGRSIMPEQWVISKGRARPCSAMNKQLNAFLDQQEYLLYNLQKEFVDEGKPLTAPEIARRYRGDDNQRKTLVELYNRHNQQLCELVGKTVAQATYTRHCTSL